MKSPKEIGEILKAARQKKGLTEEKIYKVTHIQPNIIKALEEGRADEVLNRVYIALFLRKYASFLGLDGDDVAREYKALYKDKEAEVLLNSIPKKEPIKIDMGIQKWMTLAVSVGITILVIFFIIIFGIKFKTYVNKRKAASLAALIQKKETISSIPKEKSVELVLKSQDDVWLKVARDGTEVFQGTLYKNGIKNFTANEKIELWVGKAEVLDFTINGKPIGKIGRGVIKNIQISAHGLKIGNKWLLKEKE